MSAVDGKDTYAVTNAGRSETIRTACEECEEWNEIRYSYTAFVHGHMNDGIGESKWIWLGALIG